ncbi:hypothetical protein C5B42_00040 [Candidatus Cerribacteria bacterium 'Amazon FNV 2010 28 9']|uniref:Cell envelope-related transcriptional attenuator domain-containing protein n=1 Tax=Candidatus Cerribacteria bacterium 'Amazon FNV 2010 28 9' TaxID=2081795 RepID=A0A317JT01_9BACT|nr:MAG: hypothetical protein C5B42_00040 [Candidatus Cerribacteria bacterium 'Amazon FNV 2010 28 9']
MPRSGKVSKRRSTLKKSQPKVVVTQDNDPLAHHFRRFWKVIGFFFIGVAIGVLILCGAVGFYVYRYMHTVARSAHSSIRTLLQTAYVGWNTSIDAVDSREIFLLLGVDTLATRDSDAINTDTIMVISVNTQNGNSTTFSIPRDVWISNAQVKINGLYNLALKNKDPHPELATQKEVSAMTGLPIQHTIVIDISTLGSVIDAVGGLDVTVDRSFTDTQFPREGVDVRTVKDPKVLYETVSFTKGVMHMDGKTALEFIRSRHSSDPIEGSDDARVLRQQKVIASLLSKLQDTSIVKHPNEIGSLLGLYSQHIEQYVPFTQVIALGRQFLILKKVPKLTSYQIPIQGFADHPVLYHPAVGPFGEWIYAPLDPTWKQLQTLVHTWIQ